MNERETGAVGSSGFDRFVAIMREALPTAAVALLLAIIAYPLINPKELSFLLSKDQAPASPDRMLMESPRYRGFDAQGRPFELRAVRARQRTSASPDVELTTIAARMTLSEGPAEVRADAGVYNLENKELRTLGNVAFDAPNGYKVVAQDAVAQVDEQRVAGNNGIQGSGPLGRFSAQQFTLDLPAEKLVLTGRARLHITPARSQRGSGR